jgi:hypothetical protein
VLCASAASAAIERAQLAAVHLCDAHYITDVAKYISVLLLSLRAMLHLELPHINVLSKVDLVAQYGDLGKRLSTNPTPRD